MYNIDVYLRRLQMANIPYEKCGTGTYKGDFYVAAGNITPHIHVAKSGLFVGLKGKRGAISTLVNQGNFNIDTINSGIDDLKTSATTNDKNVTNALLELARHHKTGT